MNGEPLPVQHGYPLRLIVPSWQWWELVARIDRIGTATIRARATDLASRAQPLQPERNRLGCGNNAVQEIAVHIR